MNTALAIVLVVAAAAAIAGAAMIGYARGRLDALDTQRAGQA